MFSSVVNATAFRNLQYHGPLHAKRASLLTVFYHRAAPSFYCIPAQVQNLSGGELQRVAIALCLGQPADIYLIDEPSAYLDSEQRIIASKVRAVVCCAVAPYLRRCRAVDAAFAACLGSLAAHHRQQGALMVVRCCCY